MVKTTDGFLLHFNLMVFLEAKLNIVYNKKVSPFKSCN